MIKKGEGQKARAALMSSPHLSSSPDEDALIIAFPKRYKHACPSIRITNADERRFYSDCFSSISFP
jgi:hypothetical protein